MAAVAEKREPTAVERLEADWRLWLWTLFPEYLHSLPAKHHTELWDWVWNIRPGVRPKPFVAIWPRGGAKSTSAELACVALGARRKRRYGLYVSETQDQADDHVANIGSMLESPSIEVVYPPLANRLISKYGHSRGWRRNRLRTATRFTIDSIGLDTAARGIKLEEARPDFIIFDDLDGEHDGPDKTAKKIKTLTHKLIPAGADDCAILAIQNLVHPDSIFSQLADGRADFLADRIVSGPVPAVEGMQFETDERGRYWITGGSPTWEGQSLAACQGLVDDIGLTAFLGECQHEVEAPPGGLFDHLDFRTVAWDDIPELVRTVVWVDPAVTSHDDSDSMGIQVDGISETGDIYRLRSWEQRATPQTALMKAIRWAVELGADHVGVETDQGGDTWRSVYDRAADELIQSEEIDVAPRFTSAKAGQGHGSKVHRASQMLADYEKGRIFHVEGTNIILEKALRRFPRTKPFDLVDSSYWSWHDLRKAKRSWRPL